MLNPSLKSRFM